MRYAVECSPFGNDKFRFQREKQENLMQVVFVKKSNSLRWKE